MTIVYFYQYFTTPKGSYGTRVYEFTKKWVERGHKVIVVTSVYAKSDIRATKFLETQVIDGITLKIINVNIDNKQSFLKRIYTFLVYSFFSIFYALTLKCDLVISSSGPITAGIPGLMAKIFRRKKFVFEVRDLWPEGPIELGVLNNRFIQKASYAFEKKCYKNSSLVVALSPGMKSNITNRFPMTNSISVTNSANIKLFSSPKEPITHSQLVKKKFAVYTGNIGLVNNSELLYRAAKKIKKLGREDVVIVLIGDGQQKAEIMKKSEGLDTILFLGLMPKVELVNYVKNALVSLIPLNDTPMLSTSSPNKLFESMAAAVPVIQTTNGWISEMLEESQSGFTVSPTNEDELVEKLIFLADNETESQEIGKRGFEFARRNFDKDVLATRMIEAIEKVYKN
ncbi:glycosyltransferase family 4 protein [Xanthomarina gelatinilytica]|uniref:glycosyltransferase family 4 protein n=1 Tax=Xanthomarina gelatinilytica TaxID=1137281 RepID=UPI003AA86166